MAFKTSTSPSVYKKDDTVHCWQGRRVKRKERNLPVNFGRLKKFLNSNAHACFENLANRLIESESLGNLGGPMQEPII